MIGTIYEMVYYLTLNRELQHRLGMTLKQFNQLHRRVIRHELSEKVMSDFLLKCECVCIRPRSYAPAVFEKNEHLIDELTLLQRCYLLKKGGIGTQMRPRLNAKDLPDVNSAMLVAKKHGYKLVLERMELPSVWSYEPHVTDWDAKHLGQIVKLFGYNL